jgi:hypothetical protein
MNDLGALLMVFGFFVSCIGLIALLEKVHDKPLR